MPDPLSALAIAGALLATVLFLARLIPDRYDLSPTRARPRHR